MPTEDLLDELVDGRKPGWFWIANDVLDRIPAIGMTAIGVYCVLARHANGARECWPAVRRISETTGLKERAVRYALTALQANGLIQITERRRDDGTRASNGYTLLDTRQNSARPPAPNCRGTLHVDAGGPCTKLQGPEQDPVEQDSLNKRERGTRSATKRAAPLPEPFPLTEERKQFALDGGMDDVGMIFGAFKDHHRARGSLMKDWDAAWRTWCRKELSFREERQRRGR